MSETSKSVAQTERSAAGILADMSDFLTGSFDVQVAMQLALDTLVEYLGGALYIGLTTLENDAQELSDELPHLFERFYRGSFGQQEGIPGTGLGLAICQEIVNRYQGSIVVESEVGKGTTVTVHLPAAVPPQELDIL